MPIDINLLRVDAGKYSEHSSQEVPLIMCALRYWYKRIGGDPEKVKASERARFRDETIVDQIIEIDNKWRKSRFYRNSYLLLV
jgi:seryl-tRNA synthetase